jgi:hypothetical protein
VAGHRCLLRTNPSRRYHDPHGVLFMCETNVSGEGVTMRLFPLSRFASCLALVTMALTVWSVLTFATH